MLSFDGSFESGGLGADEIESDQRESVADERVGHGCVPDHSGCESAIKRERPFAVA